MTGTAFTRAVSPRLAACELTHMDRAPIDVARAAAQHAGYEAALRAAGLRVVRLPALPDAPDSVFVEDVALMLDGVAVLTRPGSATRAAESAATAAALGAFMQVQPLPGGRLDGGDVLRVGRVLYCGLSARTDEAGCAALTDIAGPLGFSVVPVRVTGCLHLKTGVTWLGADADGTPVFLANLARVDTSVLAGGTILATAPGEDFAANTLRVGGTLLVADGASATRALLARRFPHIVALDIGELQRAEAGLTCMSLIASWL